MRYVILWWWHLRTLLKHGISTKWCNVSTFVEPDPKPEPEPKPEHEPEPESQPEPQPKPEPQPETLKLNLKPET